MSHEDEPGYRLSTIGPLSLSTSELIDILLGKGASEAVRALLGRDGAQVPTLDGLQRLTAVELQDIKGIGAARAAQFLAAIELGGRVARRGAQTDRHQVRSPADAAELLMPEMSVLEQEQLRTILLNTRNMVISIPIIYQGSLNSMSVRVGEVFRHAVKANAAALIVVHNHPSGDPAPSPEDVRVTRSIVEAGKLLGVDVLDHVVIGQQRFVSMKERGLGF